MKVHLLGPGDEGLVRSLAMRDGEFGHEGDGPLEPLEGETATEFLADPATRYWVVLDHGDPVGQLYCVVHRIRSEPGREVLLFEIATRRDRRREGIGRLLLETLDAWLTSEGIVIAWVLADDEEARRFYESCGWVASAEQPTYLERTR